MWIQYNSNLDIKFPIRLIFLSTFPTHKFVNKLLIIIIMHAYIYMYYRQYIWIYLNIYFKLIIYKLVSIRIIKYIHLMFLTFCNHSLMFYIISKYIIIFLCKFYSHHIKYIRNHHNSSNTVILFKK